jgi:hypothetical protein
MTFFAECNKTTGETYSMLTNIHGKNMYWNGITDFCTVKKMPIMTQNLVDPKPQINKNTENIKNLACSDPQS